MKLKAQQMKSPGRGRRSIKIRRSRSEAKELRRLVSLELLQGSTPSGVAKFHAVTTAYIYSIRKQLLREQSGPENSHAPRGSEGALPERVSRVLFEGATVLGWP